MPTLGECDEEEAKTVHYFDSEGPRAGLPAYAGQALLQVSCGNGQYCHAPAARNRYGVPKGLDFDVRVACEDACVDESCEDADPCSDEAREELEHNRMNVFVRRRLIAQQVDRGLMPPGGQAGTRATADVPPFRVGPRRGSPRAPSIDTAEGRSALRNWLACGAPIVRETTEPAPALPPGTSCGEGRLSEPDVYPECIVRGEGPSPEPHWRSIYEVVIEPECVTCHAPEREDQMAEHQLDLSTRAGAYEALVGEAPRGQECANVGMPLIAPGDADGSLLVRKMEPDPPCGDIMPVGARTPLSPRAREVVDTIRQWIDAGAEREPSAGGADAGVGSDAGADAGTGPEGDAGVDGGTRGGGEAGVDAGTGA